MRNAGPLSKVLLIGALALGTTVAAHAEAVRIGGTGAALGTMARLGEAFENAHPGTKVTAPSTGEAARRLIAFARSTEGTAILQRLGHQVLSATASR